jgi:prepilin-type N-terminal cleavage/methylation domain-containing protein
MTSEEKNEDGFTLVELIVASLLLALVISVIGGLMYSTQKTEVLVQTTTTATTSGQAVINSVENGVRNSEVSAGQSVPIKLTNPTGSDQMLTALVVGSGTTATTTCKAWYYSASAGTVSITSSTAAISAPTVAQLATWTQVATGVSPISGSTIFSLAGTTGVNLSYKVSAGLDPSVPFSSTVISRTGTTGTTACF